MKNLLGSLALVGCILGAFLLLSPSAKSTVEVSQITGGTITPLTDGETIAWAGNQGYAYSIVLGGDHEFANPTDLTIGSVYTLLITQDGTGTRIPSWGSGYKFAAGAPPALTAYPGATDLLTFFANESSLSLVSSTLNLSNQLVAPSSLVASTNQKEQVTLTWVDNSDGEESFYIERDDGLGFEHLGTAAANATTFIDVIPAGTYDYRIKSYNHGANSAASNTSTGTSLDGSALAAPNNCGCSSTNVGSIDCNWADNSSDETGFLVEVSPVSGLGPWTTFATKSANVITATASIAAGNYNLRVRAVKNSDNSSASFCIGGTSL